MTWIVYTWIGWTAYHWEILFILKINADGRSSSPSKGQNILYWILRWTRNILLPMCSCVELLYIHTITMINYTNTYYMYMHTHIHEEYILTQWIKTSEAFFKKDTSHFIVRFACVRGCWRPNRTATYWPPLLWPSALCRSRSPDAQPEVQRLSFLLAFSTTSCHQRV